MTDETIGKRIEEDGLLRKLVDYFRSYKIKDMSYLESLEWDNEALIDPYTFRRTLEALRKDIKLIEKIPDIVHFEIVDEVKDLLKRVLK